MRRRLAVGAACLAGSILASGPGARPHRPPAGPGDVASPGVSRLDPENAPAAPKGGAGLRRLTLERIYGDPPLGGRLPAQPRFSPDGDVLAFLEPEEEGDPPSVWLLALDDLTRRILVPAKAMPPREREGEAGEGRGEETAEEAATEEEVPRLRIDSYRWSPAGTHLLVSAGGDLFVAPVASGEIRRLTGTPEDESDPKFSPDGKWIAFVRDHNLHALPTAGGDEVALTREGSEDVLVGEPDWVSCEELELCSAYWWSPDSSRLALLRFDQSEVHRHPLPDWLPVHADVTWERYPKAGDANARVSLGVVGLEDGTVRWLETGADPEDYLARVVWGHDGSSLLIQRLNRGQDRLVLVRLDLAGGGVRTLLEERDDHWINLSDDLRLLEDGRILWSSERDGWRHLYLHGPEGDLLRRLTEGPWTVTGVDGVDEEKGWVYFTATEKSYLERHLYRVRLDGKGFARLTTEEGTHSITMGPRGRRFLDRHSRRWTPWSLHLRRADGTEVAELTPGARGGIEGYALPRHEFLELPAPDGAILQAEMIFPSGFEPTRRYPVLIYVYGGPHAQVVRDAWGRQRNLWHAMMAERGYLIFSLDNRGSYGRGHVWETAIDHDLGRVELEDQLVGVRHLRSLPYVDPDRIGIWGWSYGGYMTLYAMTHAPGSFRAGVSVAPVTDWKLYDTIYTERYMERPRDNPDGYRDSSPLNRAGDLRGRLLLVHGTGDDNVHMQNSVHMIQAFIEEGVAYDLLLYPRQKHGIRRREARIHLFRAITRFLLDHL